MQRSHRALLQRRALASVICRRHQFYKVSLSLAALWVLVFLFNLWISFGDGHTDGSVLHPVGISTWDEANLGHSEDSNVIDAQKSDKTNPVMSSKDLCESNDISKSFNINIHSNEEPKNSIVGEKGNDNGLVNRKNNKMENPSSKLIRTMPLGLEEFKSRGAMAKTRSVADQAGNIIHRVEPGGAEYNYASASKGAKVLAFNKEAKGASNILIRDKDKYLRNPCSAEEKFVVVELSEETLVDIIEMANFEHYSSNLKDFELLGTLIYPTDLWIRIGNFTAANAKHAQRFVLQEPKWVRYLKVNLLSHYGSEFYCTLSVLEVYGVDAVERMLEDLISAQDSSFSSEEVIADKKTVPSQPGFGNDDHKYDREQGSLSPEESSDELQEITQSNLPDLSDEFRHHHAGRMPGDTVLKILMQKVRSLDINLLVLERYLEELNLKYGSIFKEFDRDMGKKTMLIETIQADIANLLKNQDATSENVHDLIFWKSLISLKLDHLQKDNAVLRSEVEKMVENHMFVEKKGIAVLVACISFSVLGVLRLCLDLLRSILIGSSVYGGTSESSKFCCKRLAWIFLVLSCSIIIFIQSIYEVKK